MYSHANVKNYSRIIILNKIHNRIRNKLYSVLYNFESVYFPDKKETFIFECTCRWQPTIWQPQVYWTIIPQCIGKEAPLRAFTVAKLKTLPP